MRAAACPPILHRNFCARDTSRRRPCGSTCDDDEIRESAKHNITVGHVHCARGCCRQAGQREGGELGRIGRIGEADHAHTQQGRPCWGGAASRQKLASIARLCRQVRGSKGRGVHIIDARRSAASRAIGQCRHCDPAREAMRASP